jgi:hypothetical protein
MQACACVEFFVHLPTFKKLNLSESVQLPENKLILLRDRLRIRLSLRIIFSCGMERIIKPLERTKQQLNFLDRLGYNQVLEF